MPRTTLTTLLLVLYVLAIIGIGLWNSRNRNTDDYFLASRSLPAWLLAVTFIASWWGGGSATDLVDHAHQGGLSSFWIYGVPVLIATGLMFLFSRGIRNIGTVSQPQLMTERYNDTAGLLLTIFVIIFMVIAAAVQVIVMGRFFQSFFDISYEQGAVIGTSIVLLYSLFGGFRGVVLTDLLQFVFFLITALILFGYTYVKGGGFSGMSAFAENHHPAGYTHFFSGVSDHLAYVITFGTSWMIQANIWQRISAAKTGTDARKMMAISFVVFIPLYLMVTFTGMFSSVFYETVPAGGIVPDMISKIGSPVLAALLFLGLSSAIMSTMDSLINTGALSLTVDIYQKYLNPAASPEKNVVVARMATFITAAFALLMAIKIQSVLTISWIASDFLTSGAFVPLVLGFVWARGNSKAAVISMIFGLLFSSYNLAVALGAPFPVAWEIASVTQALIGLGASLLIYVSVSFCTKPDKIKSRAFIRKANMAGKEI